MGFRSKRIIAFILHISGISSLLLRLNLKRNGSQCIRIVNYHNTTAEGVQNFQKQIMWMQKYYRNVAYDEFVGFLAGDRQLEGLPGIMITFDDGRVGNYEYAKKVLDEFHMTGYFMIPVDLVGTEGYMDSAQLKDLIRDGHVIGSHTCTHHRMRPEDSKEVLEYEIAESKHKLEELLNVPITIFCWCGGEKGTYTPEAQKMIEESGYQYGFMTNSCLVTKNSDKYHLQRTNLEDTWSISLVKFQLSGIMDWRFYRKRKAEDALTMAEQGKDK